MFTDTQRLQREPPGLPLWLVQSYNLPRPENPPGEDGMYPKGYDTSSETGRTREEHNFHP